MVPSLREKGFYESETPRSISWPEYNNTMIDEAVESLEFIQEQVDTACSLHNPGKVGRPLTYPKDLAKAVLLCEELGFTERNAQGWLKILGKTIGITQHLDDKTIGDAYDKPEVLFLLKQIFDRTKNSNGILMGDGTGLETSRKQNYENTKKTGEYMVSIVDSREVVQAFSIESNNEKNVMKKLVTEVYEGSLRLDAGFVDRELVQKISDQGLIPYVFPMKSIKLNGSPAWKNMYMELFLDVMTWLTEYHQRSHTESFHSSIKQVYGPITKRRLHCKLSQITARIILHNRRRISYFNKLANAS
jgi:transposase